LVGGRGALCGLRSVRDRDGAIDSHPPLGASSAGDAPLALASPAGNSLNGSAAGVNVEGECGEGPDGAMESHGVNDRGGSDTRTSEWACVSPGLVQGEKCSSSQNHSSRCISAREALGPPPFPLSLCGLHPPRRRVKDRTHHPRLTPRLIWASACVRRLKIGCTVGPPWVSRQDVLAYASQASSDPGEPRPVGGARLALAGQRGTYRAGLGLGRPTPLSRLHSPLPLLPARWWARSAALRASWSDLGIGWGDRGQSSHPNHAIRGHASCRWYPGTLPLL
jgi:hypothetical protein